MAKHQPSAGNCNGANGLALRLQEFSAAVLRAVVVPLAVMAVPMLLSIAAGNAADAYLSKLCTRETNCACTNAGFCVTQLIGIRNPQFVHLKIIGYTDDFFQIRQGNSQQEVHAGEQTSVKRAAKGYTKVSVQACRDVGIFGSKCSGWEVFTLDHAPTGERFATCTKYADKAVAQVKAARNAQCNVSGDRWSKDRNHHYEWCLGLADANYGLADSETSARASALGQCQGGGAAAPQAKPKGFAGTWSVSMQPVGDFTFVIAQSGPGFTGQMVAGDPQKNGSLQGSLEPDGNHMRFSYVQPQLGTGGTGRLWLEGTVDHLGGRFFVNGNNAVFLLDGTRR